MITFSSLNNPSNNKNYNNNNSGEKNQGGILGGLGYVGAGLAAGVGSVGEGIIDLLLAGGGLLTGNVDYAKHVFKDNTVGNWFADVTEDFNPGTGWEFAGNVTHGLGQSSVFLLNLIPGLGQLGTAAFFAGVGSQGISSAAATTGDVGFKEVAYGVASGAVEGALEKALGGMGKIGSKALGNITKTAVRKGLVGQILSDAAGEFGEEFASEYIDTFLQRGFQIDPNKQYSFRDALYAGAVGFTSGAVSAGSANVLKAIGNERVGDRIVKSGNSQTLVNTATKVADKLAAQGTNWDRAGEWVKALRGQVDAYSKLSESEKTGMHGKTILGEMKSSLFFAETQSTFDLVKKSIQDSDEQTRATFAEYINRSVEKGKRNGKDYTAADIAKDTDGVAWQLAIYKFVPSLFDLDGALADMQQESEIADVVAKQGGEVIQGANDVNPSSVADATASPQGEALAMPQMAGARPAMQFDLDENAVNLRSDAVEVEGEQTGANPSSVANATASPQGEALMETSGDSGDIDGATEGPSGTPVPTGEVDLERAKRDAERIIEWERKEAPTVDELNRVRGAVKDFDYLPSDRQMSIVRMMRTSKNIDEQTVRGLANLMSITNKKGQVLAGDVEIRFADGIGARGVITTTSGGKKVILVDSSAKRSETFRGTIAHELVHYLENRKGYKALAAYAYKIAKNEKIQEVEDLYDRHYKRTFAEEARRANPNATEAEIAAQVEERMSSAEYQELVESEVTASIVGEAFKSEKFLKRYAQVGEEKGILKTAARFIKGIFNSTKDKDADLSREAQNLAGLFDRALASEVEGEQKSGEKYSFSSIGYSFFGRDDVTIEEFESGAYKKTEGYKAYVDECLSNMRQSRADFNEASAKREIERSIDGIVRVAIAAKNAGYDIYDSAAQRTTKDSKKRLLFSSLEPNSDYFTSSDISTICDKRKNFTEIENEINRIEAERGVPREKRFFADINNFFVLHDILARHGLTTACRQCYVESMRKNLGRMANAFITLVTEENAENKKNAQLYNKNGEIKSGNADLRVKVRELMEQEGIDTDYLTFERLTNGENLADMRLQYPLLYEAYNSFYGQSKPKMPKSATPFRFGELTALLTDDNGKINERLVRQIESTGGFRLQSYSDFQIKNYVDVLQVIFEAGTLGLTGHAYTKVPAFLEATANTNLKRNISIFMYRDGDEWKIDRKDSFPYTLDKIYDIVNADKSGDTGIIAVSQNDDMSAWIMANDQIAYGIPFHKSGTKMGVVRETVVYEGKREIKGYTGIKDHTRMQSEVYASGADKGKKVKAPINIYSFWDFDSTRMSKKNLVEKNLKAYIDACEEKGYLPKFRDYVMNNEKVLNSTLEYAKKLGAVGADATVADISFKYKGYTIPYGYYKFLGDFSMFTPDGKASPHEVLSLKNYDFDAAVNFFSDSKKLRINELLQQLDNGPEREKYRKLINEGKMTITELGQVIKKKRDAVVAEVLQFDIDKANQEYIDAKINSDVLSLVERVEKNQHDKNDKVEMGIVTGKVASDIYNLTGINVDGFKIVIEARLVEHILNDHGKNGKSDRTMSDNANIARLEYTLNNYDDISRGKSTQAYKNIIDGKTRGAQTVLYEKSIGEKSYYVVQAVPDTKAKTLFIVSTFIGDHGYKKEAPQFAIAESHSVTSEIGTADTSNKSIQQNAPVVNTSDKKSSNNEQYDLDPEAVEREAKRLTPKTEKTEKKKAESAVPENGKTYTKKSLVDAIETVLSEFKSELFGTSMVTLSKSKITKLVDDHLYRQMNRKTDDSEKGSISTKLVVASMLDDYLSYLRVTDENGNIRKLTDVYSESEIDEIKQKLVNYLTEEINNRGVRTVDAEQKGEKFAKKEDDRQLKKRAERGGFTEKDTRDAVKRVTEYTDEQLSELFDSQSAKVSKVQKEEFARDLLMALTTKDGKKRIKQIVDRFASDYVDKVRITVDGKQTYLSSLYDDEGIAALKKELAEKIQKDLTASGKDSLYIDIINRLENAKREFSRDLLDAEKTFKYGNAIIAEAEKLKENVGYRKRSVNDSVIYMLEKEMAKIVDHQKQISLSSVNKAIKMWSDFYNKENPLLNHGGTLTDTASDYFDVMRLKIDDFLASRKSREGYALNGKEMELLSQIIGSARSILINHDTRFLDGKRISVKKEIYSFIKDQDTYNSTRSKEGKSIESSFGKWLDKFGLTKIGQATNQGYLYKIIAPEALIGNIEGYSHNGILSKTYNAVQSGADKAAKLRAQLLSPFENFLDGRNADGQKDESLLWEDEKGRKHKYRDRLLNKTFEFQGEQITYGEAIYFYGITKRAQAEKSLNIEGVSVYDDKTGKFRTEFENIDIDSVQAELESHFTDLDYKYIEMFEKLFNADARRIKSEADIEFAGWTNLVSGYYIPLIKDAFTRDNSVSERPAIENLMIYYKERFQKHTTDNAKQLQIVNIQSIIESYVSGLASYVHLSQPMKTFDMLWNGTIWLDENGNMVDEEEVYKKRSSQNDGENSHKYKRYSIRKTVNRDVWQGADKYFIDLFNDIQGKRNMSDFDRAVSKWTGRWASGVLGANIKVIFTQTTSLVAATKNISPKNIASALSILSNKKAFAEVAKRADEYSDIIFPRSFDSGATRSQGNIDKLEDFNKNWGKGIEITDRAVCILLYHAAEIQVERTRGFKVGSEENANAAKELADRTIHETQAMTSQTERSAWQRETNLIAKTVTMFSSDAVKQLSYLYNAASRLIAHHRRVQNGDTSYEGDIKADKKALRRALAVSLSTTAMLTAIAQLFKLLYHQEEEEPEDQAVDVLKDFTSNALGILPLASEIYDKIFNDYDVSIMVLDMFNTVVDDGSTLVENVFKTASGEYISTNQIVKPMYNIAKNVSTMMGIPLAPAMRTVTGLVRRISPGTAYAAHDSFLYNMSYTSDLKKAVENGDTALASHILETLYNNEINAMVRSTELEEVARLYGLGNTSVIPQKIGTTVNDVKLDAKQRKQFESIYGAASGEVDKLIRSTYYQELTDDQKAKAIKNLYALYYNRAAAEVAEVEWSNAQAYSHLTDNYSALFAAQAYKSGLSPYKTLRGKEVSVKDQFVKYVENLGLNEADKLVVLYANGYRDAATKKKMLAYINSLSISEEEKTRIAERLGFAVENGKVVEKKEELEVRAE